MGSGPSGIKTASKAEERGIVRRAEQLADDPSLLLPDCIHDDAASCHFRDLEEDLEETAEKYGDKKKLERASSGWFTHQLVEGYASTLIVAMEGEAPYLGTVTLSGRKVPYANRGKADKATRAAVQHHDDPQLRVLPLTKDIKKKGLHVYSSRSGWWCTGTEARPPDDYVDDVLDGIDFARRQGDGVHACPHVPPDALGDEGPAHLVVHWRSAGIDVAGCEDCIGDDNTAMNLMAGIASPDPSQGFDVDVHLPEPECRGHEGTCPATQAYRGDVDPGGYLTGQRSDADLIGGARHEIGDRLRTGDTFLMARDVCYGDDVDAFLDALGASERERAALEPVLAERSSPLVAEGGTANQLLAQLWDDHGRRFLEQVSDAETAEAVAAEMDPSDTPPGEILRSARDRYEREHVEERLPTYGDLPQPVEIADRIARTHRIDGRSQAVRKCDPDRSWGPNAKAVGFGFLLALDAEGGEEWKFNEEERESGQFLRDRAEALLEAEPGDYHDALVEVARAAGVTSSFSPQG